MKKLLLNSNKLAALMVLLGLFVVSIGNAQTTIFQFNFTAGNAPSTDNAVGTPAISTIGTIGGTLTNGCTTNGYSGDSWDAGDAIRFTVNTTGFVGLSFSYNERASNVAINNFLVRVSADGTNWTEVVASYVPPTACTGSGNITIPDIFSDVANLFIEIYKVNTAGSTARNYRIDDATLTGFVKTNYYSKSTGNLNTLSNWGTNTDGTGTAPANFTTAGQIFNIRNNAAPTIGAAWTVSGTGSKAIVGNGTNACNFTVPSGFAFTGTVDVSANATLTLTNTTIPTLGTLSATSTVVYNGSGAQTISVETYGNLTYSGTNTGTAAGSFDVVGTFTCSGTGNVTLNSTTTARTFNIGTFIMSSSGTIECGSSSGTSNINVTGNFSKTAGYIVTNGSAPNAPISFTGSTQNIQSNGGTAIKWVNFIVTNGSTCTFNGSFAMEASAGTGGSFTVNSGGALFCGTNNLTSVTNCTFTLASGGTLAIGSSVGITTTGTATGNIQTNTRTFNTAGNYIYNGGGAQAAGNALPATLGSLTVNNNTTLTLPSVKAITNNFSITAGSSVNLGTFSHTAGTLTMGGFGTPSGSHGSTTSAATNKNNTFFAATTGIVTVGTGTCGAITAVLSGTNTICNGGSTNLAVTITGGLTTYTVVYSGGTVNTYTSGSSISVSPLTTTTYTLTSVKDLNGCSATVSGTPTVTVNPKSTAAVISGSATICSGSSTNLSVAITGGTSPYSVIYTDGTSSFTASSYVSGSNISVTPASTTTYTIVSVQSSNGCFGTGNSGSAVVTIDLTTSTNGGVSWSNGTPSATKSVIFDGSSATLGSDLSACSLRLTNNATVTVASGSDVTLNGRLTVDSGSTFTLNNNANLLQNNTLTNSGNIVVKRNSSALKRFDYTLWSSPVTGQGLYSFSPFTFGNRFYVYRTTTNVYNNADVGFSLTGLDPNGVNGSDSNNVPFAQGKGYLIRMPWDHPTAATVWNGTFTGVPNNGDIPYTMTNGGVGQRFNLVGNPYPSPISMSQFVSDNSSNITGTLYFWRETNNTTSNNAYCSWAGGTFTTNSEAQVFDPSGIIRTGQGFFVEASGAATALSFKNGQRTGDNANQFFRTTNTNVVNDVETNRFWLNLTNTSGAFCQMAAGYMTDATNGVDLYDGKNINTGNVLLNSIIDNTDYTIQGKALPFTPSDVIPLSYKVTTAGSYTIVIDHVDGLFTGGGQPIFLKDNLTSTEHDLQTGGYTFASDAGTFTNRFEIVYQSQLSNPEFTANSVVIYSQNNEFVIHSGNISMASVKVFDIRGRLLQEKKNINTNQTTINGGLSNEVLLVQITSEDGSMVTKKVIR